MSTETYNLKPTAKLIVSAHQPAELFGWMLREWADLGRPGIDFAADWFNLATYLRRVWDCLTVATSWFYWCVGRLGTQCVCDPRHARSEDRIFKISLCRSGNTAVRVTIEEVKEESDDVDDP